MVKAAGKVGSSLGVLTDGYRANHAGKGSAGWEKREIKLLVQWPKELLLSQKTLIFLSRFDVTED